MPSEDGEYLIVINDDFNPYIELCDFTKEDNRFSCYDYYNDTVFFYKQENVSYWMKVPEYKNLEK